MSEYESIRASQDDEVEINKEVNPRLLDAKTMDKIKGALQLGATHKIAARAAGISPATFYRWMDLGRKQKRGQFREFHDVVRAAEAGGDIIHLNVINRAAKAGDWRASKYLLQARHPEYRDDVTVRHAGEKPGDPIKIQPVPLDFSKMADEELSSLEQLLQKAKGAIEDTAETVLESPDSGEIVAEV